MTRNINNQGQYTMSFSFVKAEYPVVCSWIILFCKTQYHPFVSGTIFWVSVTSLKIEFPYFIQEVFHIALWNEQQIGSFQGVRFETGAANSLYFCDKGFPTFFFRDWDGGGELLKWKRSELKLLKRNYALSLSNPNQC